MSSTSPPHLDDEALSGLLDGEPAPAGDHLAGCAECRARQARLADARALLAVPSGELDELTRRRLISAAVAAAPGEGPRARPVRWYRQPRLVAGAAAAVAAALLAVPVINSLDDNDDTGDASTAAPALSAEAAGERASPALPTDLGELGEISPSVLRERLVPSGTPAATMADSGKLPPASPQAAAETAREERATSAGGDTYDNRVGEAEPCVKSVMAGPGQGGQLRATATGTLRGTPVRALIVERDGTTSAYIAAREGCQLLEAYTL